MAAGREAKAAGLSRAPLPAARPAGWTAAAKGEAEHRGEDERKPTGSTRRRLWQRDAPPPGRSAERLTSKAQRQAMAKQGKEYRESSPAMACSLERVVRPAPTERMAQTVDGDPGGGRGGRAHGSRESTQRWQESAQGRQECARESRESAQGRQECARGRQDGAQGKHPCAQTRRPSARGTDARALATAPTSEKL